VNTSLGIGVALHTDSLARPLAGAGVGRGALAAHRQAALVADTAITLDALKSLEVHAQFAAKVTFNDILAGLDGVNDLGQLIFVKVLGAEGGIDLGLGQDDFGIGRPNAINIAQSDVDSLLARNFNSNNSCHKI